MASARILHIALASILLGAALPGARADAPPLPPDVVYPLVDVSGVAFHGFAGMCYLDHATCPFPWEVSGNFVGSPCFVDANDDHVFVSCTGTWRDLWFNFILPGGATFSLAGRPVAAAGWNDLIHIVGMRGTVAMACDFTHPDDGPDCATNFAGSTVLVERWDCYIHWRDSGGEDCPNDGP